MNDRIDFLSPFRERDPLDRKRTERLHEGPYYGEALRKIIAPAVPALSWADRVVAFYSARVWPSVVLLVVGWALLGLAILSATWQVR